MSVSISVKINGAEDAVVFYSKYSESLPMKVREFVTDLINIGKSALTMNISQKIRKSGSVLSGVFSEVDSSGTKGSFGFRHPAANFLESGTSAHEIVPRNKKTLKFEKDSGIIFTSLVRHPGYKGKDLVKNATAIVISRINEVANTRFNPRG